MSNKDNLKIVLELLSHVEEAKKAIIAKDRFLARPYIESVEKRVLTIKLMHPQSHVMHRIASTIQRDVLDNLYANLEAMEAQK